KLQRRQRMHSRVEALLNVVKDQQTQYQQAAELLSVRVAKYVTAQQATTNQAAATKASSSATQFTRGLELQALQTELLELKGAVMDTFLQPRVETKVVEVTKEVTKELPILLRPAEVSVSDRVARQSTAKIVRDSAGRVESTKPVAAPHVESDNKQPEAPTHEEGAKTTVERRRDQTTMTTAEITELFGQFDEELSTAGSYRMLFATS
ncbi:hypothetical protein PHYSODRAFT_530025, partial [Phytophthora sojae]